MFSKSDITDLKLFESNKDIVVYKPDKCNGIVLVDICPCTLGFPITRSLSSPPPHPPIQKFFLKTEDKINNFLLKLKNFKLLSVDTYKLLFLTGSGPGVLYGLPKINKNDFAT